MKRYNTLESLLAHNCSKDLVRRSTKSDSPFSQNYAARGALYPLDSS